MTIKEYVESAKTLEELANKYLGDYVDLYVLYRFDSGNIEFSIPKFREKEIIESLPNETKEFIISIQFCFCGGVWKECMSSKITDVGEYKKKLKIKDTKDCDYFTPEQVRQMSGREVRENYHKIVESMKRW